MQFIDDPDILLARFFRAPQEDLHECFLDAYARVISHSFRYRTEET
jgi:hypothetical protein